MTAATTMSSPSASDTSPQTPQQRSRSPSPSVSPSRALNAVPALDRSASTPASSTVSTLSTQSRRSRASDGSATVVRRRGYMRPQGTAFADSARNRDSVMSLGSIAHMQYYFARTGLLDGKGAQLAKGREKDLQRKKSMLSINKENIEPPSFLGTDDIAVASLSLQDGTSPYAISEHDASILESPSEWAETAATDYWSHPAEPPMLPPTVSTYRPKPTYSEPLPEIAVLRRELKEALQDACKVLEETQIPSTTTTSHQQGEESSADGFHELQGLHLLDLITLAIRAAKNYYTAHPNTQRLYSFKSERALRADLYSVLDVLKRMAGRDFRGGIRMQELTEIVAWIESIDQLIKKEEAAEQAEAEEREKWVWRDGAWEGKKHEQEWLFLSSFDTALPPLPRWPEREDDASGQPNSFLEALSDGRRLVQLHNTLVRRSLRPFGEIAAWHSDVGKPYRRAENLRYWIKAAELRWEVKLSFSVMDVANRNAGNGCREFEEAVETWCRKVREELVEGWKVQDAETERKGSGKGAPELKVVLPPPEVDADVMEQESVSQLDVEGQGQKKRGVGGPVAVDRAMDEPLLV